MLKLINLNCDQDQNFPLAPALGCTKKKSCPSDYTARAAGQQETRRKEGGERTGQRAYL